MKQWIVMAGLMLAGCSQQQPPAASQAAQAERKPLDVADIVGIELGSSKPFPECAKRKSPYGIYYESPVTVGPCWGVSDFDQKSLKSEATRPTDPIHDGIDDVAFGQSNVPDGIEPTGSVMFLQGVPEEVRLRTLGSDYQVELYKLLMAKFGKPYSTNVQDLQNAMGARYKSIEATWNLPRVQVFFFGMTEVGHGAITVNTKKARDWRKERSGPGPAKSF